MRTSVDRLAGDGNHTIADEMDEVTIKGLHRITVRNDKGDPDDAVLEIRYRKIRVLPPIGKQTKYPTLTLTVIHAQERGRPKRRKKVEWKLLTDLPVQSRGWRASTSGCCNRPSDRRRLADRWDLNRRHDQRFGQRPRLVILWSAMGADDSLPDDATTLQAMLRASERPGRQRKPTPTQAPC